jgi:hypothetical protein
VVAGCIRHGPVAIHRKQRNRNINIRLGWKVVSAQAHQLRMQLFTTSASLASLITIFSTRPDWHSAVLTSDIDADSEASRMCHSANDVSCCADKRVWTELSCSDV